MGKCERGMAKVSTRSEEWVLDMTPDPTLTDEELAEMEQGACFGIGTRDTHRLIAALRASRERIKELEADVRSMGPDRG